MSNDEDLVKKAVDQYLAVAKTFNSLVLNRQPVHSQSVREPAWWAMMVLYGYCLPSNWAADGRPIVALPMELAHDIARNIQLVLAGHIPRWMTHLIKKGASETHPAISLRIGLAVAYKKLCDAGLLKDRTPTKTIARMYGVTRRAVQTWMKQYCFAEPSLWFPEAVDEAERAKLIEAALPETAAFYKDWGRAPANPRPFGKVGDRSHAKS